MRNKPFIVFLVGFLILSSFSAISQNLTIRNRTDSKIKVESIDQMNQMIFPPDTQESVSFLANDNGTVKFRLSVSKDLYGNWEYLGIASRKPSGKFVEIKNLSLQEPIKEDKKIISENKAPTTKSNVPVQDVKSSSGSVSHASTNVLLGNFTKQTLTFYSEPWVGITLKPGQFLSQSTNVPTGPMMIVAGYDADSITSATGQNYHWIVTQRSIPEGEDTLAMYPGNIAAPGSSALVTKALANQTDIDFYDPSGSLVRRTGKNSQDIIRSVPAKTRQKIDWKEGWNVLPLQYRDEKGLPKQVILLVLVTKGTKDVKIQRKGQGIEVLSPNEIGIQ